MKEICLINKGDNLNTIEYLYGIKCTGNITYKTLSNNEVKYFEIRKGSNEIIVVKNYNPLFVKNVGKESSALEYLSKGYDVIGGYESDTIVVQKKSGAQYVVKPLDRLDTIANKFGVDIEYIKNVNSLKTDKLFVGQILII